MAHAGRWKWQSLLMWLTLSAVSLAVWTLIARGILSVFSLL